MKSRFVKSIYGVALVSALTLMGATFFAPTQNVKAQNQKGEDNSGGQARKLEGTWRVQVTIRVCATGAEIRTFPSLVTFARGGTMTETTAAATPALRGPGHGIWQHTSRHTYRSVFEAFTFNPAGAWTGRQKVTQIIVMGDDEDEFNANASNEIFDANGAPLAFGCSTAVGRRLE